MTGGAQDMGMPNFDFSALQNVLNDPSIKQMAEQIAQDPAFAQMTAALQASVAGDEAGKAEVEDKTPSDIPDGPSLPTMDAEKYAQAMSNVLQNQHFMEMAEKLGQQIMSDPGMSSMMQTMHDPVYREKIEQKMAGLKSDPELSNIMQELEGGGPAAMMKYWDNPKVLEKLSGAMGDAFNADAIEAGVHGEDEGEDGEDEPADNSVHEAASSGDAGALTQLLEAGADKDEQDEEGRTALHFACGYGEMACIEALLAAKANLDAIDHNKNTALHYAAGYGQPEVVELLLKHGANSTAKNVDGKTAKDVAELNSQTDVVERFDNYKAAA